MTAAGVTVTMLIGAYSASAATPPFTQCPAIGASPSCGVLLTIAANGTVSAQGDANVGPYDAIEDTLIGIQNDSSQTIPSLHLGGAIDPNSGEAPFSFDGDGICTYGFGSCGSTGYEGPGNSFANISPDLLSGDVVFASGLAPHSSTYFSLEGAVTANSLVFNTPPDCSAAAASLKTLWPPNHQLVGVTIRGITDPDTGDSVTTTISGVTQDEPTNGLGDGDTPKDAIIAPNSASAQLRAERSGKGDGRVYVISFTGTDTHGATCTGTSTITVLHDQRPGAVAVNSGQNYNSTL